MLEVFTVGGGEYLVNTFNAVAAWSGGGGYRSLLRVVMVMGLIYSLLVVAFTMNFRVWMNWFLQSTAIYLCLMVPTIDVKVTDRINPSLAPATVANVPLGLGVLASFTTQIGDWLTRTAETVFVMPSELNYSTNGMVYGARLFDATRNFVIRDAEFSTNLEEHFKKCVFGDVMLYRKSLTVLAQSKDLWAEIGPGSEARSQEWLERPGTVGRKIPGAGLMIVDDAGNELPPNTVGTILGRIAKEGRKYGISLGLITQRPSDLAEGVLSQCGTIISMRLNNDRDQEFVRAAMPEGARGFLDAIPALRNRECIICGEGVAIPIRVSFDNLEEIKRPASEDPSFIEMWNSPGGEEDIVLRTVQRWRSQG